MAWRVEVGLYAERQLRKLDQPIQKRLLDWLEDRIEGCKNPRHFGEPLRGEMAGFWRYRIGDYRVICEIQDQQLVVLAVAVGHRREIYLRRN
ncbi:MAG: type II toxin-antitoxin system RelE/ParE family toxin [Desulfuromonadales bacterium]|nr:type II toxin-antitoxin system RelE/ParE family toxin [Desulfuromonadales bacterium]